MATNRLALEKSPYLLQHKDNPIHWYAWGDEAFQAARDQGKPVFLSIGYSTCHWCHVMAHESFEDLEVAGALNADYICIKVDREERPDVDDLYMKALQTLSGGGGWPMSVWLTPEAKPFFAGTYFPKYRFLQVLRRVTEIWTKERESLLKDGDHLLSVISTLDKGADDDSSAAERKQYLAAYTNHFHYSFDEINGGFGGAPKFPQTMNLMVMMRQDFKTKLNQAEVMVTTTLSHMLRGGVYDHLAGGFHRYSVDAQWLVPHFEKMLYDQAMISLTLLDAHSLYGDPEFERAARETLDYVLAEMTNRNGGFYSAQDADSLNPGDGHSEEGFFATYSYEELKDGLPLNELGAIEKAYGATAAGQFEGRNILHLQEGYDGRAKDDPAIASAFARLKKMRASRPAPHLDDKIIAAWNGWMIWAFCQAGQRLNEPRYVKAALRAFVFVREDMWSDVRLHRFWRDGEARSNATAEDYASLILAGIELSLVDPDPSIAKWVLQLQQTLDQDFWDKDSGGYFTSDGRDPRLPARTKDDYDGVTPGINSMAAFNLARLFALTGNTEFRDKADKIHAQLFAKLKKYPSGLPFLALAMDWAASNPKVAVTVGEGWPQELRKEQLRKFAPYTLWIDAHTGWPVTAGKEEAGIYICEEGRCLQPARTKEETLKQLK